MIDDVLSSEAVSDVTIFEDDRLVNEGLRDVFSIEESDFGEDVTSV